MRYVYLSIAMFALTSGAASAESCPPAPNLQAALDPLMRQIQGAESAGEAKVISARMWELWAKAPNAQAQAIFDRGMMRLRAYDYVGAIAEFDRLVAYCPGYAEGYNQRAFVSFLRRDYAGALEDLDRAIALSPRHIGAIGGRALTLLGLGRTDEARLALQAALALNPWLPERGLADPGGPLAPLGRDL